MCNKEESMVVMVRDHGALDSLCLTYGHSNSISQRNTHWETHTVGPRRSSQLPTLELYDF